MNAASATLALLIASTAALAAPADYEHNTYRFGESRVEFISDRALALTISTNCLDKKRARKCLAALAFEQASIQKLPAPPRGARPDPIHQRRQLCEIAGGREAVGISDKGGENSFCLFGDRSLIDVGSLWAAAFRHSRTN